MELAESFIHSFFKFHKEEIMKKKLGALLVALVLGGTVFAENHTKGIDLQFGIPIGVTSMTNDYNVAAFTQNILEFDGQVKVATYDCFLLNDMLGIYASVGVNFGDLYALEFMIGPAFGVNLGGVRFQTGLGFHGVVARDSYHSYKYEYLVEYTAFGIALTPQFRFGASRRCSFILGCDFVFNFPNKLTLIPEKGDEVEIEFDKGFRFGATPYIGLGINF